MTLPSVLLVTGEYPPDLGGVGDYTRCLRAALRVRGLPTRVLTGAGRAPTATGAVDDGVLRVARRWDVAALRAVAQHAPRGGVVHVQYQPGAFALRGEVCLLPLYLRARRPDVRMATTFHDTRVPYLFPKAARLRAAAVRLLARTSHAALAADARDLAWLRVPAGRGHVVPIGSNVADETPPGYDRAAFRSRCLHAGPGDLVVAYFGLLNHSKGLDTLLAVFERLRVARPGARLLLVGGAAGASDPTDRRTAEALERRLGARAGSAVRTGYLAGPNLSAYLRAADVALLPYADGASARRGSLLACAAHGLPIVTTDGPGVVPPLRNAIRTAPPGSVEALAAAVLQVADEPATAEALRRGARCLAAATAWAGIAERHVAIYGTLLAGAGR